jgi:EEF1A N-terminal glycine/lysine methyltransferase
LNVEAWKNQVESQESDADDLSEVLPVRPRPVKGTKLVNSPPLSRRSSRTTSSAQTSRSGHTTPARQPEEFVTSPKIPLQHMPTIPSEPGNKTPTRSSEEAVQVPRKVPSVASLNADGSTSPVTPITPGMPGAITTDDSDTDFQSAYSRNSSGSSGSLQSRSSRRWSSDAEVDSNASVTLLVPPANDDGGNGDLKRVAPEFPNKARARLPSTATAVFSQAQPSPTFSVATVVGRGRKREPIENTL